MGKGEIARYEQFLLFPQCFQKAYFPGASKGVIVWEWVKHPLKQLAFEDIEGKEEYVSSHHFITSIFSISLNVFNPSQYKNHPLIDI